MATIRNSIIMQDRVTPVLNKMNRAMQATLNAMKQVNASSNSDVGAREFQRAENAIREADNALKRYQNNMRRTSQETSSLGNATSKLKSGGGGGFINAYAAVGLAQQGAQLAGNATDYLDSMSLMQARVKMINDGMQTTNELQDKILASANRSRSSYKDTTAAVTKLNMLAADQFKSNDEAIGFVETLNKMFAVSGTGAQESTAAMYQLTQAMGSGKLQGDEFRSIMENAPMLADAIAKSMGKSKAELKDLSSDGAITADIIKKAMTEATDDINKKFDSLPMTFGQKMTVLQNNFMHTMQPVAARFSQWLNSSSSTDFFDTISNALVTLATVGVYAIEAISNAVAWLKQHFQLIEPLIIGVGAAMLAAGTIICIAWTIANFPLIVIAATVAVLIYMFNLFGVNVASVVMTIISWIGSFIEILGYLLPLIYAIGSAIVTYWILDMLIGLPAVIAGLWAMVPPLIASAIAWLTLHWPIVLVAVAVGILIFIMGQFGITVADIIGFAVGIFCAFVAFIENQVFIRLVNIFSILGTFLSNLFVDPVGAIKMLFLDMATYIVDKVACVAKALQDLVNMIPGVQVNIVGNLDSIKSAINAAKADVKAKHPQVKDTKFKAYKDVGQKYNEGFSMGKNFANSIGKGGGSIFGNLSKMLKLPTLPEGYGTDKGMGMFKPSGDMPGAGDKKKGKKGKGRTPKGLSDKLKGGKLDKVGKIDDDVKITDEDIKMLKDVAKTEFINKYTTLRPDMKVEFTGPVTETADINKIIAAIEDMTEEALSNTLVEGA